MVAPLFGTVEIAHLFAGAKHLTTRKRNSTEIFGGSGHRYGGELIEQVHPSLHFAGVYQREAAQRQAEHLKLN